MERNVIRLVLTAILGGAITVAVAALVSPLGPGGGQMGWVPVLALGLALVLMILRRVRR